MGNVLQDLRFALRVLRGSPSFTVVAVVTLAVGIAANTTVFGWIDTILLRPIPGVQNAHELAALEAIAADGERLSASTHPDFRDFQRDLTQASGVIASHLSFFTIGPEDRPRRAMGQAVSANSFAVLGVKPFLGRMFSPEEDIDTSGAFPIAVISHRLWRTYFREDAGVVGRPARINGRQLTIVGVAPPGFVGTFGGISLDVWVPLSMLTQMGALNTWASNDRNARFLEVIVRLKPGVTVEQARAEARSVAARIAAAHPDTHRGVGASLVPIWQASYGLQKTLRDPLRILMAVCLLVLLIACANLANLLMARSIARQKEFGVRMTLGASRGRLVRQLLTEVLLLACAGALAGVLLAQWLGESLAYVFPAMDASIRTAAEPLLRPGLSGVAVGFTLLITIGAAVLSSILPALAVSRTDVNETLKEGGRGNTSGARSHRARGVLVVAEVALAAVALFGAGLAVRSFQKFATIQPGFDSRNVLVAHLYLSTNAYSLNQEKQFCRDLRLRLEAAPGIESVTYADAVPLSIFGQPSERVQVDGSAPDRNGVVSVPRSVTAPGYFRLMRIPLLAGRDFTGEDDRKAPRVVIVNQTFARRYFPEMDPIGRQVRVSGRVSTVVGMVQDSKYRNAREAPAAFFYAPFQQIYFSGHNNFFYVRASGDLAVARAALRREVAALDPNSGLYETLTLSEYTEAGLFAERVAAWLLSVLALLSVALAAVGLYSVMACSVTEQTHAIGIRMALGARRREVLGMVLRKGLTMALAGLAAGAAATVAGARLLSGVLDMPVSTAEPAVFASAALALILIALLATYVPARRATQVDPMTALRTE